MRELRNKKGKRFKKGRNGLGRWILFLLIIGVVAGMGLIFILSKQGARVSITDPASGKIYMQKNQKKNEATHLPEAAPPAPESYTFYKVLNSKKEDIVPLTGNIPGSEKDAEKEIRDPQQEKMQQIEKVIDKDMEKRIKKDESYTVQVGALSRESTANEIMSRLKSQGYVPYLIKEDEQRGRLYKVRIGQFVSIVDAQEVAKLLKRDGFDTYVVKAE